MSILNIWKNPLSFFFNCISPWHSIIGHKKDSETALEVGHRRQVHKTAEQRRRNQLKAGYDDLHQLLVPEKEVSKAEILQLCKSWLSYFLAVPFAKN